MAISIGSLIHFYKYDRHITLAVYLGDAWDVKEQCHRWRLLTNDGCIWEVMDDYNVYRMEEVI